MPDGLCGDVLEQSCGALFCARLVRGPLDWQPPQGLLAFLAGKGPAVLTQSFGECDKHGPRFVRRGGGRCREVGGRWRVEGLTQLRTLQLYVHMTVLLHKLRASDIEDVYH